MNSRWYPTSTRSFRRRARPTNSWHSSDSSDDDMLPSVGELGNADLFVPEDCPSLGDTEESLHSELNDGLADVNYTSEPEEDRKMQARPKIEDSHESCYDIAPAPSTTSPSEAPFIHIAPGIYARLRGADETWRSIENDFYLPTTCFSCTLEMCCIQDADYVICPVCKVVSPLECGNTTVDDSGYQKEKSVGLGFTMEDLCRWQSEIIERGSHP